MVTLADIQFLLSQSIPTVLTFTGDISKLIDYLLFFLL